MSEKVREVMRKQVCYVDAELDEAEAEDRATDRDIDWQTVAIEDKEEVELE